MAVTGFNALSTNNPTVNERNLRDLLVSSGNVAGPTSSASTANTNNINLQVAVPFPTTTKFNVNLVLGAMTSGSCNGKNVTMVLQHTEANSDGTANSANWLNITGTGNLAKYGINATDVANNGFALTQDNFCLPPTCKQFIRGQVSVEANGGNIANANCFVQLLF